MANELHGIEGKWILTDGTSVITPEDIMQGLRDWRDFLRENSGRVEELAAEARTEEGMDKAIEKYGGEK